VVMRMIRRHLRSIVAASTLAAALAVAAVGTAAATTNADGGDGTNWGMASHAAVAQR